MKNIFTLFTCLFAATLLQAQMPSSGLTAHFTFDDSSYTSNSGITIVGNPQGTPATGKTRFATDRHNRSNSALNCSNNSGMTINVDTFPTLKTSNAISMAFWTKGETQANMYPSMVYLGNTGNTKNAILVGLNLQNLKLIGGVGTVPNTVTSYVQTTINASFTGAWHHVAFTYTGDTMRLYLDSILVDKYPLSGVIDFNGTNMSKSIYVGCHLYAYGYTGLIDDLVFYNRAVSASEVGQIFRFAPQASTSINNKLENSLNVYPVPFSNKLNLNLNASIITGGIYSTDGKLIYSLNKSGNESIETGTWPKGIYIIKAETMNGVLTKKIIK